jgi:hypothetical protein
VVPGESVLYPTGAYGGKSNILLRYVIPFDTTGIDQAGKTPTTLMVCFFDGEMNGGFWHWTVSIGWPRLPSWAIRASVYALLRYCPGPWIFAISKSGRGSSPAGSAFGLLARFLSAILLKLATRRLPDWG